MVRTTRVTLLTVIAAFEIEQRLVKDLQALGVHAYTVGRVDGKGVHGTRAAGIADASSARVEVLLSRELAEKVVEHVTATYADLPLVAFMHEVEAMPAANFA